MPQPYVAPKPLHDLPPPYTSASPPPSYRTIITRPTVYVLPIAEPTLDEYEENSSTSFGHYIIPPLYLLGFAIAVTLFCFFPVWIGYLAFVGFLGQWLWMGWRALGRALLIREREREMDEEFGLLEESGVDLLGEMMEHEERDWREGYQWEG